jgi:hypothetical protein
LQYTRGAGPKGDAQPIVVMTTVTGERGGIRAQRSNPFVINVPGRLIFNISVSASPVLP